MKSELVEKLVGVEATIASLEKRDKEVRVYLGDDARYALYRSSVRPQLVRLDVERKSLLAQIGRS